MNSASVQKITVLKMLKYLLYAKIVLLTFLHNVYGAETPYQIPDPTIEAFTPKGLRISIPDTPGVQLFGFHGKINQAFSGATSGSDPGSIDLDVLKPTSGVWVIEDKNVQLEVGDTIYYWLFVQYENLGYRKEGGRWEVPSLLKPDGTVGVGPVVNPEETPNAVCEPTATKVNGQITCRGKLIFSDDFTKPMLDYRKWTLENRIPNEPDYEFVSYQRKPENCYVKDNNLFLVPTVIDDGDYITAGTLNLSQSCTGRAGTSECIRTVENYNIIPPVESARISSLPYFSFLYGKVEIRAKLPAGDWIFPELYLLPKDHEYGPDYDSGKMLIAHIRGNPELTTVENRQINSQVLTGGLMLSQLDPLKSIGLRTRISRDAAWNDGFHTFTLIWRPDQVTVAVDDLTYGSIVVPEGGFHGIGEQYKAKHTKKWGSKAAPFDREFYLVLGVGVGGVTDFPDNSISGSEFKPWKNKNPKALLRFWENKDTWYPTWKGTGSGLQIDYIKVWAL